MLIFILLLRFISCCHLYLYLHLFSHLYLDLEFSF